MTFRISLRLCLLSIWGLLANAHAQEALVDQQNEPPAVVYFSLTFVPTAQEFTPSMNGINFVELLTRSSTESDASATLQINIREGNIAGLVIAESTPVVVPPSGSGEVLPPGLGNVVQFDFPNIVHLDPGSVYLFEILQQDAAPWTVGIDPNGGYGDGRLFRGGEAANGSDLWFREGVSVVPEPSVLHLVLLGGGITFAVRIFRKHP